MFVDIYAHSEQFIFIFVVNYRLLLFRLLLSLRPRACSLSGTKYVSKSPLKYQWLGTVYFHSFSVPPPPFSLPRAFFSL